MANNFNLQTLSHSLNRQAEFSANKPALSCGDAHWSYREFADDSLKLAAILSARGVVKGDRIAYLGFHCPDVLLLLYAADLSSLRLFVVGGTPISEPILTLCAKRGIPVSHYYGMSEYSSAVSFLDTALAIEKINSVDLAIHLSEIKLIDEKGCDILDANIKGDICVRGGNVTGRSELTSD